MSDWIISRLSKGHDRGAFNCGKPSLDQFLHSLVTQYEKRHLGRTYVATEAGAARVAGYHVVATGAIGVSILPEALRRKLPAHPVPTIHLGRLAVDEAYRGRRLGETLLFHALELVLETSEKVGVYAVDVWAIDDDAARFYHRYGFVRLEDDAHHLYLPMKTIAGMFAK